MKTDMQHSLEIRELSYILSNFRFTTETSALPKGSIHAVDFLDHEKAAAYLDAFTTIIRSPSRAITASQFAKRYSFSIIAAGLYAMTMYNKRLDLTIENSYIEFSIEDGHWLPNIRLADFNVTAPDEQNRDNWRDETIKTIFADNLSQVWRSLAETAHIPPAILWENAAVYVYWLYETKMKADVREEEKSRVLQDFLYLLRKAPAALFGESENPLTTYYGPRFSVPHSEEPVRFRQTCCFYFRLPSSTGYCQTCPKLKHCQKRPVPPDLW